MAKTTLASVQGNRNRCRCVEHNISPPHHWQRWSRRFFGHPAIKWNRQNCNEQNFPIILLSNNNKMSIQKWFHASEKNHYRLIWLLLLLIRILEKQFNWIAEWITRGSTVEHNAIEVWNLIILKWPGDDKLQFNWEFKICAKWIWICNLIEQREREKERENGTNSTI